MAQERCVFNVNQLVAGCRLQFRWCFWGLSANLHREPLKMVRTIYMIYVFGLWLLRHFQNVWSDWGRQTIETTCNLWPESFSWSSYVVAFSLWHGFRFKHSRFWRSKFRWNRVSIRAPITLLAVDLVLQIRSHFHFFFLRFFMLYNACCMPGAKLEPRKRGLQ